MSSALYQTVCSCWSLLINFYMFKEGTIWRKKTWAVIICSLVVYMYLNAWVATCLVLNNLAQKPNLCRLSDVHRERQTLRKREGEASFSTVLELACNNVVITIGITHTHKIQLSFLCHWFHMLILYVLGSFDDIIAETTKAIISGISSCFSKVMIHNQW